MSRSRAAKHRGDDEGEPPEISLDALREKAEALFSFVRPGFTLGFAGLFAAVLFMHEDYPWLVGGAIVCYWLMMELVRGAQPDLKTLLRSLVNLIVPASIYLAIGFAWIVPKLFIYVWQGHAAESEWRALSSCSDMPKDSVNECYTDALYDMRWRMTQWVFFWPLNLIATLLKDPLKIIVTGAFNYMNGLLVSVLDKAVQWAKLDKTLYVFPAPSLPPPPSANQGQPAGNGVYAWKVGHRANAWD